MKSFSHWSALFALLLLSASDAFAPNCNQAITTAMTMPSERRQPVPLRAEPKPGGSARFTGIDDATSGLDLALSTVVSDVGSIVLGLAGTLLVLGNRFVTQDTLSAETLGQETRADLLGVFACGAVLLNGVSKLDVTSALAETVRLDGVRLLEPEGKLLTDDARWALKSLLTASPAKTAVMLQYGGGVWTSVIIGGIVPSDPALRSGATSGANPILDRFLKDSSKERYLPTLPALPGKVEFTYLPPNTQEALLLPVNDDPPTVLVLGSDTAKSFTPRDVAWCRVITARLGSAQL